MASAQQQDLSSDRICGPLKANADHLECSICHSLLWKPVACETCETPFCSTCINRWLVNNPNKCPNQCKQYIERKCPPFVAKLLSQLQISCSYQSDGCQQTISYEALEEHETKCDYRLLQCSGCQLQMLKKDFEKHESDCALIELTCGDCNMVYRRGEAATKHTESKCLKEQLRQLRDESKEMRRLLNRMPTQVKITFDDLPHTDTNSIFPNMYRGLKWSSFYYTNEAYATKKCPKSGYVTAFVKGGSQHLAYSKEEASISTEGSNDVFALISVTACAAWNDNLQLTITGFRNCTEVNTHTTTLLFDRPQFIQLHWTNIDKLIFKPFGGTPHPNSGRSHSSLQFVLTQLTIT